LWQVEPEPGSRLVRGNLGWSKVTHWVTLHAGAKSCLKIKSTPWER
jgi:hypothetical protein